MNSSFWKIADKSKPNDIESRDKLLLWSGFADFDYWFYARGFFEAAMVVLKKLNKNTTAADDKLVFPLMQNIHMFLELSLKHLLFNTQSIANNESITPKFYKGHDLKRLFQFLENSAEKIDIRLKKSTLEIKPYFESFYEKFPDANELFRYPWKSEFKREKFIKEELVFSVSHFQEVLIELAGVVENMSNQVLWLKDEYGTGTFTENISRAEIEKIAKKLPKREKWADQLKKVKSEVLIKYEISNSEFSKILNVIQDHKEFSKYIGIESTLTHLEKTDVLSFLKLPSDSQEVKERSSILKLKKAYETSLEKPDLFYDFLDSLEYEKSIQLYALYKAEIEGYYIESLEFLEESLRDAFSNKLTVNDHLASKSLTLVQEKIRKQSKKLGWLD